MNDTLDTALEEKPDYRRVIAALGDFKRPDAVVLGAEYTAPAAFKDAATELAELRAEAEAGLAEVLAEMDNPSEMPPEVKQAVLMSTSRSALSSALETAMRMVKDINSNAHSEFTRTKASLSPEERMQQLWHEIDQLNERIDDDFDALADRMTEQETEQRAEIKAQIANLPEGSPERSALERRLAEFDLRILDRIDEEDRQQGRAPDQRSQSARANINNKLQNLDRFDEVYNRTSQTGVSEVAARASEPLSGVRLEPNGLAGGQESGVITLDGFEISGISPELLAMAAGSDASANMNTVSVPATQNQLLANNLTTRQV